MYAIRSYYVTGAHRLDVIEILPSQRRHRDVEDIDVGLADQIEQQIERPLEGVEHDFEGIRRDVEILRQRIERLTVDIV